MYALIRLVSAFGFVAAGLACDSGSAQSLVSAVGSVESAALQCDLDILPGEDALSGLVAGACNPVQATYAAMHYAQLTALAGRCYCIETYYNKAKTLGDVGDWVVCVSPWNSLAVSNGQAIVDYTNANGPQLFAPCNVCDDTVFPTMDPQLKQVQTVLDFVMDWRGTLLDTAEDYLREGVTAAVTSAVLGNGQASAASSPTSDWIVSQITKGKSSTAGSGGLLLARQDNNSTNTTATAISELINVQVKMRLVPVNVTTAVLEGQLKKIFNGTAFAGNLTTWNANLTSVSYSTVVGNQSATTTSPSGSAAASPSPTAGLATSLMPTATMSLLGFVICLLSVL